MDAGRQMPEPRPAAAKARTGLTRQATSGGLYYLTRRRFSVNCIFLMASIAQIVADRSHHRLRVSPAGSGVFLWPVPARPFARTAPPRYRGPQAVLLKWHRDAERDPELRDIFYRMVEYRRHVLAIFDSLVGLGRPETARSISPSQVRRAEIFPEKSASKFSRSASCTNPPRETEPSSSPSS